MYLLNAFSSTISVLDSGISTIGTLTISTNTPRHTRKNKFKKHPTLTVLVTSKKAAPTVYLSNTNVNAERSPSPTSSDFLLPASSSAPQLEHSFVPFPTSESLPVSCPPSSHAERDDPDGWHLDLHRRRAKSCLASSYIHCNTHTSRSLSVDESAMQSNGYEPDTEGPFLATRKRKLAASVRRVNVKKGLRSKKEPKGKVSRKHVAMDVQFAATVHRSIERQLKCAQEACYSLQSRTHSEAYAGIVEYAISEVQDDSLLEQDKMLVERLRQGLVDQGFKGLHSGFDKLSPPHGLMNPIELAPRPQILVLPPVSLEFPPLLPSLPVEDNMSSTLDSCSEHVDRLRSGVSVSPPIPIPVYRPRTEDPDSFDLATPSLSPPLPSILNFPSPPSPLPELAIPPCNALPSPLTTPPSTRTSHMRRRSHDGLVLEMPQLVASLILRHRDRAASRPRSRSKSDDAGNCTSKARSPLWKTVDVLPQVEL